VNERIRELAEQAETKEVGYYFFDREKFAELIVKECAMIGELKEQGSNDYDHKISVGWYMRQHFGVE
jgi:hypothetical protein